MGDNTKACLNSWTALKAENVDVVVGIGYPAAVVAKASGISDA